MATYLELYALLSDEAFIQRVRTAKLQTAMDVWNLTPDDTNEAKRLWAEKCLTNAEDGQLQSTINFVVCDPAVISAGSAITDANLQAILDDDRTIDFMVEID
jgi:hypothetical protein